MTDNTTGADALLQMAKDAIQEAGSSTGQGKANKYAEAAAYTSLVTADSLADIADSLAILADAHQTKAAEQQAADEFHTGTTFKVGDHVQVADSSGHLIAHGNLAELSTVGDGYALVDEVKYWVDQLEPFDENDWPAEDFTPPKRDVFAAEKATKKGAKK